MMRLRRMLAPVTAVWLFCQVGTVASVPLALWLTASAPHEEQCTCGHEAGVMCPMHHKTTGRPAPAPCAMQAANSSGTAVVTTLVGVAGLISEPTLSIRPADASMHPLASDVRLVGDRPVPPDPPPPRT
jgi:hypothetical protein